MNRRIKVALVVAALALAMGCGKKTEKANATKIAMPVTISTAKIGNVEKTIAVSGRLEGGKDVYIAPEMPGTIAKLHAHEGDKVQKGELLVEMKPENLEQVKAQYDNAKKTFDRMKSLLADGAISQQQYDGAKAGYQAAKAAYDQVKRNTKLTAPFSGIVVSRYFDENDMFAPGYKPGILRLARLDKMKLTVRFGEMDFPKLREGLKVVVSIDAYPDSTFTGKLIRLSPGADPLSGTFTGEIEIDNPHNLLTTGLYSSGKVIYQEKDSVLTAPASALLPDSTIFVFKGGTVHEHKVKVGMTDTDAIEILSGIQPGDRVVVTGNIGLRDGMTVKVEAVR